MSMQLFKEVSMFRYKRCSIIVSMCAFFMLGIDNACAADIAASAELSSNWPVSVWYGLSIVLLVIGFVSAKIRH